MKKNCETKNEKLVVRKMKKMKRFILRWSVEQLLEYEIEAENEEEVKKKFLAGDINPNDADISNETYIEDSLEVNEVEE